MGLTAKQFASASKHEVDLCKDEGAREFPLIYFHLDHIKLSRRHNRLMNSLSEHPNKKK